MLSLYHDRAYVVDERAKNVTVELMLLRHAKSSWSQDGLPDHERPLNQRGRRAAKAIAKHMHAGGLRPDHVLCSTAVRTRQTVAALLKKWPDLRVEYKDSLYLAAPETVLVALSHCDPAKRVLCVGHNPSMEQLVSLLLDPGATHNDKAWADVSVKYPTGALTQLRLDIRNWTKLMPNSGTLVDYTKPRDLE